MIIKLIWRLRDDDFIRQAYINHMDLLIWEVNAHYFLEVTAPKVIHKLNDYIIPELKRRNISVHEMFLSACKEYEKTNNIKLKMLVY